MGKGVKKQRDIKGAIKHQMGENTQSLIDD